MLSRLLSILTILMVLSRMPDLGANLFAAEPFPFETTQSQSAFPTGSGSSENDSDVFEVPIPLDTIGLPSANAYSGYVPDLYGSRPAPVPSPLLRPRYLTDSSTTSKLDKSDKKVHSQTENTKRQRAIRQVSDEALSHTPPPIKRTESSDHDPWQASLIVPPPPQMNKETASLPKSNNAAAAKTTSKPDSNASPGTKRSAASPGHSSQHSSLHSGLHPDARAMTINNEHSCDEWTCGGGCYSFSNSRSLHLSEERPVRGLCPCCGLMTCARKVRGDWFFDGWLSVGSFMNLHWPDDRDNKPLYYNDRNGESGMNQLYLSFGRRLDTKRNRWSWGGRIDLLYGTDYIYTSSLGLETRRYDFDGRTTLDPLEAVSRWNSNQGPRRDENAARYGLSLPQAYAELFLPFGDGLILKAGHFYSETGLESAMSPRNFFYSHSYSFMYGAPVTLTGGTATMRFGRQLSATVGVSQGWNVFDSPIDNVSGLAGVEWKSRDKRSSLSFLVQTGEESIRGDNRTNYTLTFQRRLGSRWRYALEHSFGYEKNGSLRELIPEERGPARWFSLAQYLQWELSEKLAAGMRIEWFRDDGHSRIQKGAVHAPWLSLSGKDYYEWTLGLNWKPTRFVTIRPEIRYDWSNVRYDWNNRKDGVFGDLQKEMFSFAIDAVFRF